MPEIGAIIGAIIELIVFWTTAYYLGNVITGTFNNPLSERLISTLFGAILWCAIGGSLYFSYIVYQCFLGN